jgi:hypothetical protein
MDTKGVLGIGCSFMWGEGLYFYSNLPDLPALKEYHRFDYTLTEDHIKFKDENRFLRIIANEYKMWDIANSGNGGSNVRNIEDYVNGYLQKRVNLPITKIGLIIYQFTSQYRDYINQSHTKEGWLTGDIMPIEQQIEFVNNEITKWESEGVKVVTLSWYEEFPNHPLYQKYFKDRHVDIEIDGDTKNSFEYFLHRDEYNVTIASDFVSQGLQKNDIHLNLKGHKCVAKSIIKKLKKDNWQPTKLI